MSKVSEAAAAFTGAGEAMQKFVAAWKAADPEMARHIEATDRLRLPALSEVAVEALRDFLVERDWPSATPRQRRVLHNYRYSCMAAAILNGEAWAIKEAWPEAAYDIITKRSASV